MSPSRRTSTVAACLSLALACASLAYGSSFDLDPFDSAELALAAVTAGLGHPPSQPAHTIIGWLVTRGPWRALSALAWLSIAPAAIALWLGLRTTDDPDERPLRDHASRLALLLLAVSFGPVRAVATRVEVYALASMFALAAASLVRQREPRRSALALASILWGFAGATNPVLAAQAAWPLLAPLLRARRWLAALSMATSAVTTALASYLYAFAARARETETLVWSAPTDARSLWAVVTARDFAGNVSLDAATWISNALHFLWDLTRSGVALWLVAGAWGLARRDERVRDPWLGALLFSWAVGVAMVAANVTYRAENPDYGGYVLISCAIAGAGVARLTRALETRRSAVISLAIVLASAALAASHGRSSRATRAIAARALEAAPPRAIAVFASDHLLFSALYLQGVEGLRRDVIILNPGWASSAWAWRWARARDPSLQIDLTPGITRERRLSLTLTNRAPGRAVVAEDTALLALAGGGSSCPRAFLWSTREGCDPSTRSTADTVQWIHSRAAAARAARSPWDRRLVWTTALSMGQSARAAGCAGVALRVFSASLEETPAAARACGSAPLRSAPVDLLTVSAQTVRDELARTRPLVAPLQ